MGTIKSHTIQLISVFALALLIPSCLCSRPKTDEDRLREKLDNIKVHIYVGTKALVAQGADDSAVVRFVQYWVSQLKDKNQSKISPPLPLSPIEKAKEILRLRGIGKELVESGAETGVPPLVASLAGKAKGNVTAENKNADHALLTTLFFLVKMHKKSPVPVPMELVLYEASRTKPDMLKTPGFAQGLHTIKAFVFGQNDLCDFAAAESAHTSTAAYKANDLVNLVEALQSDGTKTETKDDLESLNHFSATLEIIAHGSTASCYAGRGEDEKTVAHIKKIVEAAQRLNWISDEVILLESFVACYEGENEHASKRLTQLGKTSQSTDDYRAEKEILLEYCDRNEDADWSVIKKLSLTAMILKIAQAEVERTQAAKRLEHLEAYRLIKALSQALDTVFKYI